MTIFDTTRLYTPYAIKMREKLAQYTSGEIFGMGLTDATVRELMKLPEKMKNQELDEYIKGTKAFDKKVNLVVDLVNRMTKFYEQFPTARDKAFKPQTSRINLGTIIKQPIEEIEKKHKYLDEIYAQMPEEIKKLIN